MWLAVFHSWHHAFPNMTDYTASKYKPKSPSLLKLLPLGIGSATRKVTNRDQNINCVPKILKESRCAKSKTQESAQVTQRQRQDLQSQNWDVKLLEHAGAYSCLSRKCQHRRLSYKETKYFIVVFIRVNEITQLR